MSALADILRQHIARDGPMPLDRYMLECLAHPDHGYYMQAEPFGQAGDFTTAPEISQMFGEMLALWLAEAWLAMGRPQGAMLVEMGPGRGTLMADALRALSSIPTLQNAFDVRLIETSPRLQKAQKEKLKGHDISWHKDFSELPKAPLFLIANELFDALPIRQFVRTEHGFAERHIALDQESRFIWCDLPCPAPSLPYTLDMGRIAETSPMSQGLMGQISHHIATYGGAALIIDYGPAKSAAGDSLQAVKAHAFSDPLEHQGESDLTAHVDFEALAITARTAGAFVLGPTPQGHFLRQLGIEHRAKSLKTHQPEKMDMIDQALHRLVTNDEMGQLFKVLGLASHPLPFSGFGDMS